MKRFVVWVLSLLMVFCCVSCSPKETYPGAEGNLYSFETDDQSTARVITNTGRIAESEEGFYFISVDGYLFFTDKNTMKSTLLCNRPDCRHQEQGSTSENTCNAYVGYSLAGGPFYYNGALYCITDVMEKDQPMPHPALTRISLDGTKRKVVWNMEEIETGVMDIILHRGKVYYVDSDTNMTTFYLRGYDLNEKKVETIYESNQYFQGLRGLGEGIYWSEAVMSPTSESNRFLRYSTADGTTTTYDGAYDMYFDGEKVFFFHYEADMGTGEARYWFTQTDADGTNPREVSVDRQEGMAREYRTDGKYLYEYTFMGGGINVYDYSTFQFLKTVDTPDELDMNYNLICADGKVFLYSHEFDRVFYGNSSEVESDGFAWTSVF